MLFTCEAVAASQCVYIPFSVPSPPTTQLTLIVHLGEGVTWTRSCGSESRCPTKDLFTEVPFPSQPCNPFSPSSHHSLQFLVILPALPLHLFPYGSFCSRKGSTLPDAHLDTAHFSLNRVSWKWHCICSEPSSSFFLTAPQDSTVQMYWSSLNHSLVYGTLGLHLQTMLQ